MATVKKGTHVAAPQWAVHLRPYWKRLFWKRERGATKEEINRCRGTERITGGMAATDHRSTSS